MEICGSVYIRSKAPKPSRSALRGGTVEKVPSPFCVQCLLRRGFRGPVSKSNAATLPSSALFPTPRSGIEVQNYEEALLSQEAVASSWTLEGSRDVGGWPLYEAAMV